MQVTSWGFTLLVLGIFVGVIVILGIVIGVLSLIVKAKSLRSLRKG